MEFSHCNIMRNLSNEVYRFVHEVGIRETFFKFRINDSRIAENYNLKRKNLQ